jgi:hypothetical protein
MPCRRPLGLLTVDDGDLGIADYLVTRSAHDYTASPIPVVTPSELLAILRS